MSPPRFRVRSLILTICVIALSLGWWFGYKRMKDRAAHFRGLAARAAEIEGGLLKSADFCDLSGRRLLKEGHKEFAKDDFKRARAERALAVRAAALHRAYERSVQRPWIAPPPPDSLQELERDSYAIHSPFFKGGTGRIPDHVLLKVLGNDAKE